MARSLLSTTLLALLWTMRLAEVGTGARSSSASARPSRAQVDRVRSAAPSRDVRFRGGVDLVALDVCVKDRQGRFLEGLKPEDFLILDGDVRQKLAVFDIEGRVPLAVVVLIDGSGSMIGLKLDRAKGAAVAFVRALRAGDLVEVLAFNERVDRRYTLGADQGVAEVAIETISAEGQTGLFEAVLVALRDLQRLRSTSTIEYRRAIVVLSDGEDTSSRLPFEDVLEDVRRSGVLAYAVSLRDDERGRWLAPARELAQLAYDSGGRAVAVQDLAKLTAVYEDIHAELRHLYRLGFVPEPAVRDGSWRPISVRVVNRDLRVRTRAGYYAPWPPRPFTRSVR